MQVVDAHHALRDTALSVAAVVVLLVALVAIDERVRQQASLLVSPETAPVTASNAVSMAREVAGIVFSALRDQTIDHAPLVIFALVAGVLFLLMLRL